MPNTRELHPINKTSVTEEQEDLSEFDMQICPQ